MVLTFHRLKESVKTLLLLLRILEDYEMGINLFKHNKEAYKAATEMLEQTGMAAVIHPTGTGKSLIAFKLAEEHPLDHFLWLSPSEYIYQTQLENLNMKFPNIQFMSYSRLMLNEDSIETLHPDYIILDVVVGFMKEKYEYLIDEYGVELVVNADYAAKNNLHSVKLVKEHLENIYVFLVG